MVKSIKGIMPGITLLLVAVLLTLTLLSACDIFATETPDEESWGVNPRNLTHSPEMTTS
jgi:hypothetical protein